MALNFKIKLTEEVSGPAQKAASGLYQLDAAIKNEGAALGALQAQMRELKKSGDTGSDAFKRLSGAIADQRTKVAALKDKMVDAGGIPKATKDAGLLDGIMKQLAGSTGKLGTTLGATGSAGLAAAAGIGAIVVAATAAAGAVAYLTVKLFQLGVTASEAKGDVTRSLELLYGSEKAAEHTYKVLESLTGDIAISQDRVMELADTLIKAGQVNGDAMVRSIAAIGKAEAARAGAGKVIEGVITRSQQARMFSVSRSELMAVGLSYRELAKAISKGTGMAVGDAELRLRTGGVQLKAGLNALTSVIDTKLGDLANKKLMTVTVQGNRVREAFSRLFEGVNAEPFARVLNMIANQLSESSVSGAALRTLLKSAFDTMSAAAEAAMPYLTTLFEGAILLALKLYNATYPIRKAFKEIFGKAPDQKTFEDGMLTTIDTLGRLANAIGNVIGYTPLWYGLAAAIVAANLPLIIVTAAAFGLGYAIGFAIDKVGGLAKWFGGFAETLGNLPGQAFDLAGDIITGFVNGIQSGAGRAADALKDMASSALKAFRKVFEIKSPSRAMQLDALNITGTLAKGVNDNARAPTQAMRDMSRDMRKASPSKEERSPFTGERVGPAPVASVAAPPARPGVAAPGGGSNAPLQLTLNIHERAIVVSGNNAQEIAASLRDPLTELFADVLEKAATMSGALEIKGAA